MDSKQNNIALIGIMGSGKSTVGRLLAARLGREFVDTDELVTEIAGKTIAQIFEDDGEGVFRDIEADAVARACAKSGVVIATGGGAVLDPDSAIALKEACAIAYLRVTPKVAWERINGQNTRPLLARGTQGANRDRLRLLSRIRGPIYTTLADYVIDTTRITAEAAADVLAAHFSDRL